jgi:hypothetical protein
MARSLGRDPSINQRNDASSIGNARRKARKAKTNSNKTDRQRLKADLERRRDEAA